MFDLRHALLAYWRVRRIKTRLQLEKTAARRLRRWLRDAVPQARYYCDRDVSALSNLPRVDKATLMSDFAAFNTAGVTADMGWAAFDGDKHIGPLTVGASTGTSGNRGLFVISQAERFRWLGTILAKALPGFWRQTHRIAILLPLNTPLYDSANRLRRLQLQFFDIGADWEDDLRAFAPTVIIAPPKILRFLAETKSDLRPLHLFSGAETLDTLDRAIVEGHFDVTLGQVYMATEGLLAVSCPQGVLHLCEDTMHFELSSTTDDPDLHAVIISDFSRNVQIMARYQMNDLIRLGPACACGLPHRTVAEVVGRTDDCFDLPGGMLTPDVIRNAVVDADRGIADFRVIQTGADLVEVLLPQAADLAAVNAAFVALFARKHIAARVIVRTDPLLLDPTRKLRRVENRFGRLQ